MPLRFVPVLLMLGALLAGAAPARLLAAGADARLALLDAALAALERGRAAEARRLLEPLADQGSATAETLLGGLHARGLGGPRDLPAAAAYWWRAAQRGYAPAQLALAQALAAGRGVPVQPEAALRWAMLAERGGDDAVRAAAERLRLDLSRKLGARVTARATGQADAFRPWSPTQP